MAVDEWTTKPRPVRLSVAATATREPGRGRDWTVEAGYWRSQGTTEKAASNALANALEAFIGAYQPPVVITFRGYVGLLWVQPGSDASNPLEWREQVAHPEGYMSHCGFEAAGWDEAEAHTRYTIAQSSTDWHDDDSVHQAAAFLTTHKWTGRSEYGAEDLYRRAAWQRAAKAAMDAGHDDLHTWATANAKNYTVPRPEPANA